MIRLNVGKGKRSFFACAIMVITVSLMLVFPECRVLPERKPDPAIALEALLGRSELSFVQISLEGCPACEMLEDEKGRSETSYRDLITIEVAEEEKEEMRTLIQKLIPTFQYYPSIYCFKDGEVIGEFDLSTLQDLRTRYGSWREALQNGCVR